MQAVRARARDPLRRIESYLDAFVRVARDPHAHKGCLVGVLAQELSETSPAIRSACGRHFEEWAELLKEDLEEAKARYAPRTSVDAQGLARYLISVIEGSLILARTTRDIGVIEDNLRHFKQYVRSLFGKGKEARDG